MKNTIGSKELDSFGKDLKLLHSSEFLLKIKKKVMSSPSSASVKHISSVIQHTVELNIDTEIKDLPSESWCKIIANDAGIVRRSPSIEEIKFYLPAVYQAARVSRGPPRMQIGATTAPSTAH